MLYCERPLRSTLLFVLPTCLVFAVGCAPVANVALQASSSPTKLEPMPANGIPSVAKQPLCLYWLNQDDGSVWRCSLDGSRKELVVDCRAKKNGKLSRNTSFGGSRPGKGSYVALGSIPRNGYTIIDGPPRIVEGRGLDMEQERARAAGTATHPAPYTFSNKKSPWTVRFKAERIPGLDPMNSRLSEIEFTGPQKKTISYMYSGSDGKLLGLMDCDAAVLQDDDRVVLWTMKDNRRYLLARGNRPCLWTRDLSKAERFKPVAKVVVKGSGYTYTLTSPSDLKRSLNQMTPTFRARPKTSGLTYWRGP
jgi:hypothetical protein